MLLNDFFYVVEEAVTPERIVATIKLNSSHQIYLAHFPGNPVTPGVVQIQIVKEILQAAFNKKLQLLSMSRCKFLSILNPVATPTIIIEADIAKEEGKIKVNAAGRNNETTYFKLSAVYQ